MTTRSFYFFLTGIGCILYSTLLLGQQPFKQFGITNYGGRVAEPFHSGGKFWQDSLGKLQFGQYSYDGHHFKKEVDTLGRLLLIDDRGGKWYKKDHFEILYAKRGQQTIFINTKSYFKYDVNTVYLHGDRVYLVTNLGAIEYVHTDSGLKYIRSIPVSDEEIWSMHILGDTLFFKSLKQSIYLLQSDLTKEYAYGQKHLSNFNNGIVYLPNQRIICKSNEYEKLIAEKDFIYHVITAENDNHIIRHFIDSKHRLWLALRGGGRNGLFLATAEHPFLKYIDLGIENSAFIRDIYEDDEGNIWISTNGQGIIRLQEEQLQVLDKSFGLASDNIWSVTQDSKGTIFFSSSCAGIDILYSNGELGHQFGTNCQEALYHDSKGNFWINTRGPTKITAKGKSINYQKEDGLMSRSVRVTFEDGDGNIWLGSRKGVHKYIECGDGNCKGKFIPYQAPGVEEFDRVCAMREYEDQQFIIAFNSGKLFSFDGINYTPIDFSGRKINSLFKDQEGKIWIATNGDGLFLFDNGKIIPAPFQRQLPKDVKFLQDDLNGKLWGICEQNQIFSFSKSALLSESDNIELNFLSIEDGVPLIASNNDIQPSTALLDDGRLIFPNIYGAILIDPNKAPKVIDDFHTQVEVGDSIIENNIQLSLGQNDITLRLKPIILSKNHSINYQYKLADEWRFVDHSGALILNNLSSGNNKISLRSRSGNNPWKEMPSLFIEVPPLYYQRWSFWILSGLALTGLIALLVSWRMNLVKQRNKLLKEKVAEQTLALSLEKEQLSKSLVTQKQLTHELNLSQEAKNRMYAQISHEFNSPLQAIKANLKNGDGTIIVENHKRISNNINKLINISNEIMQLSKAESGKLKAKKNWYNINGIIKEQIELLKPLADQKNIEIIFQNKHRYFLDIDISLIQKVIGNLLSNAIKFSTVDQVVQISSKTERQAHLIEISDHGLGIPATDIPSLTLPYYQATNNIEKGTGIGLSLVAEILKLHDSELKVKSELGVGSSFSFSLKKPSLSQEEILKKHIDLTDLESQIKLAKAGKHPLILAVDDSRDVLFFINQTLSTNYQVINASNGANALKVLEEIEPALIISDVNMPILNGMELLKTVRNIEQLKAIPFLFLTGSLTEDTELQSIKAGADFLIKKPIQEGYLLSKIEQMIAMRRNIEQKVKSSFSHNLLPKNIHNDDLFLMKELETVILENMNNSKLKSEDISSLLGIGEKTLRNRVKKITGHTIKEYLRRIRLEKAKLLIEENHGTLGEIAVATGFSSLSYFTKSYKAYFSPAESK